MSKDNYDELFEKMQISEQARTVEGIETLAQAKDALKNSGVVWDKTQKEDGSVVFLYEGKRVAKWNKDLGRLKIFAGSKRKQKRDPGYSRPFFSVREPKSKKNGMMPPPPMNGEPMNGMEMEPEMNGGMMMSSKNPLDKDKYDLLYEKMISEQEERTASPEVLNLRDAEEKDNKIDMTCSTCVYFRAPDKNCSVLDQKVREDQLCDAFAFWVEIPDPEKEIVEVVKTPIGKLSLRDDGDKKYSGISTK